MFRFAGHCGETCSSLRNVSSGRKSAADPGVHFPLCALQFPGSKRQRSMDIRLRAKQKQIVENFISVSSCICTEGENPFPFQGMLRQKLQDRHGQRSPPERCAKKNGIILLKPYAQGLDGIAPAGQQFKSGNSYGFIVIGRIRRHGRNLCHIRVGLFLDIPGKFLSMACFLNNTAPALYCRRRTPSQGRAHRESRSSWPSRPVSKDSCGKNPGDPHDHVDVCSWIRSFRRVARCCREGQASP